MRKLVLQSFIAINMVRELPFGIVQLEKVCFAVLRMWNSWRWTEEI